MTARISGTKGIFASIVLSVPLFVSILACNKVPDSSVSGFPKKKCGPADTTSTGASAAPTDAATAGVSTDCSDAEGGPGGFGPGGDQFERTHRVLIIGLDPRNADPNDPTIPKDLTPELILQGLEGAAAKIVESGTPADLCLIAPIVTIAEEIMRGCFTKQRYDVIVVGAGIRTINANVELLESVVNLTQYMAPRSAIGFNKSPVDSAEVAARIIAKLDARKPGGKPEMGTGGKPEMGTGGKPVTGTETGMGTAPTKPAAPATEAPKAPAP